ncbi:hypothetical protein WA1_43170 [Scytonema hofmannii PCC 7110]|uniref:NACHT domain-containing protein n=1 Tax=Scytonema hofmannii PCC 7110 TaxID=128403 RepID=A0A139WVQ1_9CYAN|nr:NACHT domain-containing protein [Scytonema hofmannii]KYC36498.1 hypothetical protein WA1_43170 [Scytonema hofmannii PCC 7110]
MDLNETQFSKADPLLQEALIQASDDEVIRSIFVLETGDIRTEPILSPSQFPSRQAYREALIAQRKTQMAETLGGTMKEIRSLSLKTAGDTISPILIVEGSARQTILALELPGVRSATLEQLVGSPETLPAEQVDAISSFYFYIFSKYLDELRGSLDKKNQELSKTTLLLTKQKDRKRKLEEQIKNKQREKESDKEILKKLEDNLEELNQEIAQITREVNQLTQDIATLPQQIDRSLQDKNRASQSRNLVNQTIEQYILSYHKRYGKIKILGMQNSVNLESLFTRVRFLDQPGLWRLESAENMQETFRQSMRMGFEINNDIRKLDGLTVAKQEPHLMVLGAPGAGKSTFLRKLGLEAFKGKKGIFEAEYLPILIELKRLTSSKDNLVQIIKEELKSSHIPLSDEFVTKALELGKLLILLDGLDEMPAENLNQSIQQFQAFVNQYPHNHVIISCRVAAYRQVFQQFKNVEVADFDEIQIQQFIRNWFCSEGDRQAKTAERCWVLLNQSSHKSTKELARTPLLLAFICLVYNDAQDLPTNRSSLYKEALDILLKKWWSEKRVSHEPVYRHLGVDLEEEMLAEFAYQSFKADRLFFSKQQLIQDIQGFLIRNENAPKDLDAVSILEAIAIQQGILVERARDVYSFSHLTLQEYLTAQYTRDHNQIGTLVTEHLFDERWREVFLLLAGLIRARADELLVLMEKEVKSRVKRSSKLSALLRWADRMTDSSEGSYVPVAERSVAIFIALAFSRAYNFLNQNTANSDIDMQISSDFDRMIVLDESLALRRNPLSFWPLNIINNVTPGLRVPSSFEINFSRAITLSQDFISLLDPSLAIYLDLNLDNTRKKANGLNLDISHTLNFSIDPILARTKPLDLVQDLEKSKIFKDVNFAKLSESLRELLQNYSGSKQTYENWRKFRSRLLQVWCQTLQLSPNLVHLSKKEVKELENYLYANLLIVLCKQAAVKVSKSTWKLIESGMLRANER